LNEDIKKQAKEIMDEFMAAMERAGVKPDKAAGLEREAQVRTGLEPCQDKEFPELMLKNAPKVKDHSVVAERKNW